MTFSSAISRTTTNPAPAQRRALRKTSGFLWTRLTWVQLAPERAIELTRCTELVPESESKSEAGPEEANEPV